MARPRVALLDRDKITTAALDLIDKDGELTMPGLARHLGVQVSSVYHHIPGGRAELIELVRVLATSRVDGSAFDTLPWDEAFPIWAQSFLDAFSAHPAAIRLLATEPVRDPSLVAIYNSIASGLRRAGFPDDEILGIITAAEDFFLGAALDSAAPDIMVSVDNAETATDLQAVVDAAPSNTVRAERAFELGVRVFIAGLRTLLPAEH